MTEAIDTGIFLLTWVFIGAFGSQALLVAMGERHGPKLSWKDFLPEISYPVTYVLCLTAALLFLYGSPRRDPEFVVIVVLSTNAIAIVASTLLVRPNYRRRLLRSWAWNDAVAKHLQRVYEIALRTDSVAEIRHKLSTLMDSHIDAMILHRKDDDHDDD